MTLLAAIDIVEYPMMMRVQTSQQASTHGRAKWSCAKCVSKPNTFRRDAIDVRRAEIPIAVKAQISPSLVVSQNYDDVRPTGLWLLGAEDRVERGQKR